MSIPKTQPKAPRSLLEKVATKHWSIHGPSGLALPSHYLLAVRGYRRDTMGKVGVNDFGIWDDALFYLGPKTYLAKNANTDPSRVGWNASVGKPMAVLNTGVWAFRRGPHKGRTPALRQMTHGEARQRKVPNDGRFTVTRTYAIGDKRNYQESGYFAINVHPGGNISTSSEGCLTIRRPYADKFLQTVWDETLAAKVNTIWCLLVDGPII